MMRVPLETGHDKTHDRDVELRPGQINRDGAFDAGGAQTIQRPPQIRREVVRDEIRHILEPHRRGLRRERIEQRIADLGFRRLRVFLRREVVADASDIGEPSLRCLGQGAAERDRPVAITAAMTGRRK